MIHPHTWMLVLAILILVLTLCMVYPQKCDLLQQPLFDNEMFDYSEESAKKICQQQAQLVTSAPFIGTNTQAAYENCMNSWTPAMNMPSAWLTSADWQPRN